MEPHDFGTFFPAFRVYYPAINTEDLQQVRQLYVGDNARPLVANRVLDLLGLGADQAISEICKTVLVESDYVDRDYSKAYRVFYARRFRNLPRRCTRFHFFNKCLDRNVFLAPSQMNLALVQQAYLGYSVIHNISPCVVGRTVIRPRSDVWADGTPFLRGTGKFRVNIAGYSLDAYGVPFVQQDGRVAACASCALWTAMHSLSRRFSRNPAPSPTEITRIATKYALPREQSFTEPGLDMDQMILALNHVGYEPIRRWGPDVGQTKELLARYAYSHIPAILVLELESADAWHAVTVSGFVYGTVDRGRGRLARPAPQKAETGGIAVHSSCEWITAFLVHDDQSGPYRVMQLENVYDRKNRVRYTRVLIDQRTTGDPDERLLEGRIRAVILPLPQGIYLQGLTASKIALNMFLYAQRIYNWGKVLPKEMVSHTYLVTTNDFKHGLMSLSLPPELVSFYRGRSSYRLGWVTEFGSLDQWLGSGLAEAVSWGEVLLDSTCTEGTYAGVSDNYSFIGIHVPGYGIAMGPDELDWRLCAENDANVREIEEDGEPLHDLLWSVVTSAE